MKQIKLFVAVFIAMTCYGSDSHSSAFEKNNKDTVEDTLVDIVINYNDSTDHVVLDTDNQERPRKIKWANGQIIDDPLLVIRPTR